MLGQWASGGLPLPQAKASSTVAQLVILFGPEPQQWDSDSPMLRDRDGSQEWAVALLGAHTPSENPPPIADVSIHRLSILIDRSSGVRLSSAQIMILVTFVVTLRRR